MSFEATKNYYLNYFYNFLRYIFIYVLPIHIYYVIYHSFDLSPREILRELYNVLKSFIGFIVKGLKFGFKRSVIVYKYVFDAPELPISYKENNFLNNKIKKKIIQLNNYMEHQTKLYIQDQELKKIKN